ncbi:MAG: phosphotransferase [Caulobacterales bacterium]
MTETEEPLRGGLADGRVFRVGDTVRRPAGEWTPTVHALLEHLQFKGFPAPRPLGLDEQGREKLSYLPGVASNHPWPPALLATPGARQVGALLRAYHAAVADFTPPSPAIWRHGPRDLAHGEIALHGDFAPHNLIWDGDRLAGVIDFELARPGRPMEDAVFAALRVAHLRPDHLAQRAGFDGVPDRRARLEAFAEGFGCRPDHLIAQAAASLTAELERITSLGGAGVEPWATFLAKGLDDQVRTELAWVRENAGRVLA